jgi:primosomal protein N' (replication factor Y)
MAYTTIVQSLFASEDVVGFARVAVERSVDRYPDGLTYAIPSALKGLGAGESVVVPLGRGDTPTNGYVIEITGADEADPSLDPSRIKPIERRDTGPPRLTSGMLALARWISGYYCCPIGMTLASMIPAAVKRNIGSVSRLHVAPAPEAPTDQKLPPKQAQVMETIAALPPGELPIDARALADAADLRTVSPIKRLVESGRLVASRKTTIEATWRRQALDDAVPDALTRDQRKVIDDVTGTLGDGFSCHLLFGVTGAGKTEVYIRLIERVVAAGQVALLLVPEIALTPQTGGRLIGRFPDHRVAVLHSGLTAAQRHQQWAIVASGDADIILGARSAVFAPVPDGRLGLIIVDEEHDGSYKQDQAPRYHGRDVAVRRGQLAGCPVLLGSATPSLESWHNATSRGIYALHSLPKRAPGLRVPTVEIVDFVEERRRRNDRRVHLLGPRLERAVGETLGGGGQVLLLLNRRGYANYIACPDQVCGWVMTCDHCDVTMVCHQAGGRRPAYVRCHHCLCEQRLRSNCPECGRAINVFGLGTQRVEEELHRKFPALVDGDTMQRVDSDTMRRATDFHETLDRFARGELRLLLGTQMIAKGLDFPGVRLVGVINADTAINLPDFRAGERTFGLVSQVAGRCGRGVDPGRVIVQTFQPEAPPIRLAADHDFVGFATQELADRESYGLPPATRLARLVVRDADHPRCTERAQALASALGALAGDAVRVRGPAPCPIARISGRHRWQVELLADGPGPLQRVLAAARDRAIIVPGADLAVDVDPLGLL